MPASVPIALESEDGVGISVFPPAALSAVPVVPERIVPAPAAGVPGAIAPVEPEAPAEGAVVPPAGAVAGSVAGFPVVTAPVLPVPSTVRGLPAVPVFRSRSRPQAGTPATRIRDSHAERLNIIVTVLSFSCLRCTCQSSWHVGARLAPAQRCAARYAGTPLMPRISSIEHGGWSAVELLAHTARLVIVHGVGPRIAWFGAQDGANLLFWDELGTRRRGAWRLYGGHRLWVTRPGADESEETYQPDNQPCQVREIAGGVAVSAPPDGAGIEKTIAVRARASGWTVEHQLRNVGDMLWSGGAWALTCTLPGAATRYHVPLGEPEGPWDVFTMVIPRRWGGGHSARLADPQFELGEAELAIHALGDEAKRMVFSRRGTLVMSDPERGGLIKRARARVGARYPLGTNLAVYLGPARFMVELETMSPTVRLAPGEKLRHVEHWTFVPRT
jgi:hypothetical protein